MLSRPLLLVWVSVVLAVLAMPGGHAARALDPVGIYGSLQVREGYTTASL